MSIEVKRAFGSFYELPDGALLDVSQVTFISVAYQNSFYVFLRGNSERVNLSPSSRNTVEASILDYLQNVQPLQVVTSCR